ncbi:MAG: DNA mismatch repair endonuclease MutL [Chroococcidiopsidaceae cyanobacterium CP_BM_ER_R8_30]|nr:DNA mismatch repair endonuclease MutL [Chroococcidiopsidaceae cyanobacterium CP_BM_ER_R8_30]
MELGIKSLPTEVVHRIAAGEVIDSLAAVVRELAENSLDAGATRVVVSLWPQQWRVRVADNGCGMDLTDLQQAAVAHSTSKIRSCEDLGKIASLGFRGEALHSIAQLAELEIVSRRVMLSEGWRVVFSPQGQPAQIETAAIAPGTVVTVANLFANWSSRRQGLPSPAQQMKAVQAMIWQIALCHPHVTWQVWQNDREWFTLSPGVTTHQLLPQILRQVRLSDLQEIKVEVMPHASIQAIIGLPDRCHRHRPDWVRVAVNGRMVKLPELEQTILKVTARTLPRDRYPICFLHLHVAPDQIDWNRHPAKAEIYLRQSSYWQEQITQTIEQALRISPANLPEAVHSERVGKLLKAAEAQGVYATSRSVQPASVGQEAVETEEDTPHPLIQLQAVAQVHNTYILAEHPSGLWLVEQHIAHERVLYEQLLDNWQLVPQEPPAILKSLSLAQQLQLQRLGIEVEPFGEQLWAVRTVPALLLHRDDGVEALLELSWGGDLQAAQVATACRTAIRNGTPLSLTEMQTLLDRWRSTRHPRTCPHGRPIYLSLEESALSRFFRRHWVIGKSHGI